MENYLLKNQYNKKRLKETELYKNAKLFAYFALFNSILFYGVSKMADQRQEIIRKPKEQYEQSIMQQIPIQKITLDDLLEGGR